MVELKGTEKQIKWAEEIRKEMLESVDCYNKLPLAICKKINSELFENVTTKEELEEKRLYMLNKVREYISSKEKAKWFIDAKMFSKRSEEPMINNDFIADVITNDK